MQNGIKLLCNKCFNPLTINEYPEGIYVDSCECIDNDIESELDVVQKEAFERGRVEGYGIGYDEGYEDRDNALDRERESLIDRVDELEEIVEKYKDIIDDEMYNERMGI